VQSKSSPIALSNLLVYLQRVATMPEAAGQILDAGGPEYFSYETMMRQFGEVVGKLPAPRLALKSLSHELPVELVGLPAAIS
jgi:uncharacterized protein YbjT (DUF2867 family)